MEDGANGTEHVYSLKHTYTITMKTKLTLTIDADLVPKAKRYARSRGVSLSSLVNEALEDMTTSTGPSFVDRWRGRFAPADRSDPRYEALAEKYR